MTIYELTTEVCIQYDPMQTTRRLFDNADDALNSAEEQRDRWLTSLSTDVDLFIISVKSLTLKEGEFFGNEELKRFVWTREKNTALWEDRHGYEQRVRW